MSTPQTIKDQIIAAKIGLIEAETHGQEIDNRTAAALALASEISAEREKRSAEWESVANSRYREYQFTDTVDPGSVQKAIDTLTRWDRMDTIAGDNRPYKFVICSPGGSVVHGIKLYTAIKALATKRDVLTIASGFCASMATVIHQAGSLRVIEPGCSYLLHDVSGDAFGSLGNMEDTLEWLGKLNSMLTRLLSERATTTFEELAAISKRKDAWFMPEDVMKLGLADTIGYALHASPDMPIVNPTPPAEPVKTKRKKV